MCRPFRLAPQPCQVEVPCHVEEELSSGRLTVESHRLQVQPRVCRSSLTFSCSFPALTGTGPLGQGLCLLWPWTHSQHLEQCPPVGGVG